MQLKPNNDGLYEFEVEVIGPRGHRKTLKGLIDTGSTECACTYKIITTLKIRPVAFEKISTINSDANATRVLVYSTEISFNRKSKRVSLYRLANLPEGIDLILGMSFLSNCSLNLDGEIMKIDWRSKK